LTGEKSQFQEDAPSFCIFFYLI